MALAEPARLSADGTVASTTMYPTTRPGDPATAELVTAIRDIRVDALQIHVTGPTTANVDLASLRSGAWCAATRMRCGR